MRLVLGEAEVLEPRLVAVLSEHDPTFPRCEALLVLELALGDALFPLRGGGVGFACKFTVEPMLDLPSLDDDLAVVPFAGGFETFVGDRFLDVVDGRGGVRTGSAR